MTRGAEQFALRDLVQQAWRAKALAGHHVDPLLGRIAVVPVELPEGCELLPAVFTDTTTTLDLGQRVCAPDQCAPVRQMTLAAGGSRP